MEYKHKRKLRVNEKRKGGQLFRQAAAAGPERPESERTPRMKQIAADVADVADHGSDVTDRCPVTSATQESQALLQLASSPAQAMKGEKERSKIAAGTSLSPMIVRPAISPLD